MAQRYYLTIDRVRGDSTREGQEGAFDVNSYSLDISSIVEATRGAGHGGGRSEFSPLTINVDANSSLAQQLLEYAANGRHIPSIELEGVSPDGQTVYDLLLGDVVVTRVQDASTGQDVLQFTYSQVSVTTTGQDERGRHTEPQTFSWNLGMNDEDVNIREPRPGEGDPAGGGAQNYYLTIDGVAGDSTRDGQEGAFDVGSYSFDISSFAEAARGAGRGGGQAEFSPLTINVDANSSLAQQLLEYAANGRHIPSIELEGVSPDGQTVYDLLLGDVVVTRVQDASTGQDVLQFSYSQVSVTTTGQDERGRHTEPQTFSWNLATNEEDVNIREPRPGEGDDQHLNGNEANVLVGSPGGILTGVQPGHDQFVFRGDFGRNEITNFSEADQIVLERSHFGNANEILEHHATDDGHGNTVITDPLNPDNVIVLDDVSVQELDVMDFVLL
jgi:type VI protein secretion system component Hcp